MNFLPQRPKEIIRKYEQLDARDELNAACSEIANRISEKQKQRMDLHGALEDLVSKKTETSEDILKLQRQLKSLKEEKFPKLKEMEIENDRLEKKISQERKDRKELEDGMHRALDDNKAQALKDLTSEQKTLIETITQLESEYAVMLNWVPSREGFIEERRGEQRNSAQERDLAQESLILWSSHQLHTAVEREICRMKHEVKRLKNMISHLMKKQIIEEDKASLYEAETNIIMGLYSDYKAGQTNENSDDLTRPFDLLTWQKRAKALLASIDDSDAHNTKWYN